MCQCEISAQYTVQCTAQANSCRYEEQHVKVGRKNCHDSINSLHTDMGSLSGLTELCHHGLWVIRSLNLGSSTDNCT